MKLKNWTRVAGRRQAHVSALLTAMALCCGPCSSVFADEVYTWKDKDGVTHFSDVPPENKPSQLIEAVEAYRPGSSGVFPESGESSPSSGAGDNNLFTESGAEIAQQRREQLAKDRKERRQAQAETEQLCQKNKELLARLEPARRVMYINDQGEEVRMDDDQRVGLIQETRDFVSKNCK